MTLVNLTRKQARDFAQRQLDGETPAYKKDAYHYGKIEIEELLDQIYRVNSKGEEAPAIELPEKT